VVTAWLNPAVHVADIEPDVATEVQRRAAEVGLRTYVGGGVGDITMVDRRVRVRRPGCGTPGAYIRHHRRGEQACEACKLAHKEYKRSLIARLKAEGTFSHGLSGYINYGCRCPLCAEASRAYRRQRRGGSRP
jgi:hypothetical protein